MRMRKLVLVGTTALALATSGAFASVAGASGTSHPASLAAGYHGKAVASPQVILAGKCKTAIGSELPTPDGLIAWNDGGSFDTAGAADFKCGARSTKRARTIKQVTVNGYFGQVQELFNVTFYTNDPTNGSDEPADAGAYCTYTNVPGTAGGQYPQHVTTVLTLPTKCIAKRGINWVSVQNNDLTLVLLSLGHQSSSRLIRPPFESERLNAGVSSQRS
jgi:hypothetical protein